MYDKNNNVFPNNLGYKMQEKGQYKNYFEVIAGRVDFSLPADIFGRLKSTLRTLFINQISKVIIKKQV